MEAKKYKIDTFQVPSEYLPLDTMSFCGNIVSNVKYLINENGFIPLLLGKGPIPRLWLYAKVSKTEYIPVIIDNKSMIDTINIEVSKDKSKIYVTSGTNISHNLIEINIMEKVEINKLDLRPLGYNVFGDKKELNIGGTKMSSNTVNGAQSFIGIGS